jgi:hypothetical protein
MIMFKKFLCIRQKVFQHLICFIVRKLYFSLIKHLVMIYFSPETIWIWSKIDRVALLFPCSMEQRLCSWESFSLSPDWGVVTISVTGSSCRLPCVPRGSTNPFTKCNHPSERTGNVIFGYTGDHSNSNFILTEFLRLFYRRICLYHVISNYQFTNIKSILSFH